MRYWLDATDRLAEVDEAWRAFATENGAPELASPAILGRPMASFCTDSTTAEIWAQLFARSRSGDSVELEVRCDAPELRRLFLVTLTANEAGLVQARSELLSAEPRARVELLEAHRPHSDELLVCCSWCKRWQAPAGAWVEVEALCAQLQLLGQPILPAVSHGICGDCRSRFAR